MVRSPLVVYFDFWSVRPLHRRWVRHYRLYPHRYSIYGWCEYCTTISGIAPLHAKIDSTKVSIDHLSRPPSPPPSLSSTKCRYIYENIRINRSFNVVALSTVCVTMPLDELTAQLGDEIEDATEGKENTSLLSSTQSPLSPSETENQKKKKKSL